ncbi:hypothetical protein [Oceanobacillus neutriphilus]|uniref:Asp/Glu/hydantoin racemase n=1 Tax=Oceanobacillus neutriphilus TaxID=531815 RepID=A0ABQ2P1N5_9BACI|nr:hypothetical protein [Oceanobacillus neutriphilus]GGP15623.1 hypothetical protein GCM10011346_44420 [Oceanobacillus neutriphilus]
MRKRLGCLHAHYSNIGYIEEAFSAYDIELVHLTDPGLLYRADSDETFQESDAQKRVNEQMEWIAQCGVDAILITCTNYIAVLKEEQLSISVPIIKIDEPFFDFLCHIERPHKVISVAQLSMVDAAQLVEKRTSEKIMNPLNTLVPFVVNHLELEKNE